MPQCTRWPSTLARLTSTVEVPCGQCFRLRKNNLERKAIWRYHGRFIIGLQPMSKKKPAAPKPKPKPPTGPARLRCQVIMEQSDVDLLRWCYFELLLASSVQKFRAHFYLSPTMFDTKELLLTNSVSLAQVQYYGAAQSLQVTAIQAEVCVTQCYLFSNLSGNSLNIFG